MGSSGECNQWLEELRLGHQWVICTQDEFATINAFFPHARVVTTGCNVDGEPYDNCVMTAGALREIETVMGVEWVNRILAMQRKP